MEESVEDIGSDVDWGGESEEQDICEEPHPEEEQDVMPPPTGPWAKRRRLTEKTKPFIPHGYLVVLPKPLESSRLSRELNAPLFSVQYGSRKRKPQTLAPLSVAAVPTHRPLHAVCGEEDGQVLYSAEHLDRSSSAQLVLNAADDLQDAYSRMPLLASPSTSYKPVRSGQCGYHGRTSRVQPRCGQKFDAFARRSDSKLTRSLQVSTVSWGPTTRKKAYFMQRHGACQLLLALLIRDQCIKMSWSFSTCSAISSL